MRRRHAGATRRLKGGMKRFMKKVFGKKNKPAAQPAPAAGGGGGGAAAAAPVNEFNNGYITSNGRRFENLTAKNIAGLAPNNRERYNAFELEMAGFAAELDSEANHTPVQNATANGRRFNSLRSANIAALAPENRSKYNTWKKFVDDFAAMEAEAAAEVEGEVSELNAAISRPLGQSAEMSAAAVAAALEELEAEAAAARPARSMENLLRELESL